MTNENQCPNCGKHSFLVLESRINLDGRRRRHACSNCKYRETTYELTETAYNQLKQSRVVLNRVLRSLDIQPTTVPGVIDIESIEPLCITCTHNIKNKCVLNYEMMFNSDLSLDCERYSRKTH